jgi:hypothetical protein
MHRHQCKCRKRQTVSQTSRESLRACKFSPTTTIFINMFVCLCWIYFILFQIEYRVQLKSLHFIHSTVYRKILFNYIKFILKPKLFERVSSPLSYTIRFISYFQPGYTGLQNGKTIAVMSELQCTRSTWDILKCVRATRNNKNLSLIQYIFIFMLCLKVTKIISINKVQNIVLSTRRHSFYY